MKKTILMKLLFALTALSIFVNTATAQEYVVIRPIAVITQKAGIAVKIKPNEDIYETKGVEGCIVYGNRVTATPIKGAYAETWLEIRGPGNKSLGFIEKNAVTPFPKYQAMKTEPFWVKKEGLELFLLPGKYPTSKFDPFKLLKGVTVQGFGTKNEGGKSWVLLLFDSFYEDGTSGGVGARYAWARAEDITSLRTYQADHSKIDAAMLPNAILKTQRKWNLYSVDKPSRQKLLASGFFIDGTPLLRRSLKFDDMLDAYTELNYFDSEDMGFDKGLMPVFVTTDVALHSFHLIFDRMLQSVEQEHFSPLLKQLLLTMLESLDQKEPQIAQGALGKQSISLVRDYLMLAVQLLSEENKPLGERGKVELERILRAKGVENSSFTGKPEDYTFFAPRGHYTVTPQLEQYFRAMTLLGGTTFYLTHEGKADLQNTATIALLCSLLEGAEVQSLWKKMFDPFTTLMGASNDNSWYDYGPVVKKIMGDKPDLSNTQKLKALNSALKQAGRNPLVIGRPAPRLNATQKEREEDAAGFRLIGRRFTFDALIFNLLTAPQTGTEEKPRNLPDPLDVMAVLGSQAAQKETKPFFSFENYEKNQQDLTVRWEEFKKDKKMSENIYSQWLQMYTLLFSHSSSKQFFYNTDKWKYKKLLTASASWAELKHDTILYAEQSGAEMGGGGEVWSPAQFLYPEPRGYVEPEPQIFSVLAHTAEQLQLFLNPLKVPSLDSYAENLTEFAHLMKRLSSIAVLQREGKPISVDDYRFIQSFSTALAPLVLPPHLKYNTFSDGEMEMLKMPIIADVATDFAEGRVLYVGTGTPRQIHVFVNDSGGGGRITTGFVFSYYTFSKSLSDGRMNDNDWKKWVYDKARQKELEKLRPAWYLRLEQ